MTDRTNGDGARRRENQRAKERESVEASERAGERAKYDVGAKVDLEASPMPWSYGETRIVALVRSPDSLYLYWEITDDAIDAARARLGPAGAQGFCNLRIYDTTSRDFDGTNANHYIDIRVDRSLREYFLMVHRPGSTLHVEIGVMSHEGYFQPMARSNRAEFPRKGPSPNTSLEWMTVTGGDDCPAARPYHSRYTGPEPVLPGPAPVYQGQAPQADAGGGGGESHPERFAQTNRWQWTAEAQRENEWVTAPVHEIRGAVDLSWLFAEGIVPFTVPSDWGPVQIHGPTLLTVRTFEGDPARRVVAGWAMHRVQVTSIVGKRWFTGLERQRINAFAREEWVLGASESHVLRDLGASELWRIGASEQLWLGASAWMMLGASEWALGGASEAWSVFLLGGSEHLAGSSGGF